MTTVLDSPYSWFRLATTLGIATVGSAGMWAIVLVLPAMQAEFAIDRADASVPYVLTMIGFAVGNMAMGRAVDRFGVSPTLILAALVLGAAFVAAAYAPSVLVLSALQFLIGVGSAVCFGPVIADISQWFLARRGIAVAMAASGNYIAGAVWPILLQGTLAGEGWRAAYVILAISSVAVMIPLALLLRRRLPAAAQDAADARARQNVREISFTPRQLQAMLALAGFACCMAMAMPQVHIVALCSDLGFGVAAGGQMLALSLAGGIVSRLASGWLSDRFGVLRVLLIGSALQGISLALYLPSDGLASLYAVSLIFGLSQGGLVPAYAVIVREFMPAREAGARIGAILMATILGMAVGGWASGAIYDATGSYTLAFINGIAWNLVNLVIVATIYLRAAPRRPALA